MDDRLITAEEQPGEIHLDTGLRPRTLQEYVGQSKAKKNLQVFIDAARNRQEALDHVLFFRPARSGKDHPGEYHCPGNGRQYQEHFRSRYRKTGDLAAILTNLEEGMFSLSMKSTACHQS